MTTVLIVDDSDTQRCEVREVLTGAGLAQRVIEAENGFEGLKILTSQDLDAVLCDLEMPGLDGEKLLSFRNSEPRASSVPFLFLTGTQDLDRRARLLENGASDVIAKPFHPAEVLARLRLHLKMRVLQHDLLEQNERLIELATIDKLTGLRNRRFLEDALEREWARAQRHDMPLTFVMADLDKFKSINDERGHAAGDSVLAQVGEVVAGRTRTSDISCRYGGEEFAMLLTNCEDEGGQAYAESLRAGIEAMEIEVDSGEKLKVTVSCGVASSRGAENVAALVKAADAALYRAKGAGRNQVVVA